MPRDFIDLLSRSSGWFKALRRIALGSALTGFAVTSAQATPLHTQGPTLSPVTPVIVNRSKKAAKLVLRLPGVVTAWAAQHGDVPVAVEI